MSQNTIDTRAVEKAISIFRSRACSAIATVLFTYIESEADRADPLLQELLTLSEKLSKGEFNVGDRQSEKLLWELNKHCEHIEQHQYLLLDTVLTMH